ncbi:hypothetical protein EBZ39_07940, partial [bacterium]|nr:hypothetical protein [bacterium]
FGAESRQQLTQNHLWFSLRAEAWQRAQAERRHPHMEALTATHTGTYRYKRARPACPPWQYVLLAH